MINSISVPNTSYIQFVSGNKTENTDEINQLFNNMLNRDGEIQKENGVELFVDENYKWEKIVIRERTIGLIIWRKECSQDTLGIPFLGFLNLKTGVIAKCIDDLVGKFFKYAEMNKATQVCFAIDRNNVELELFFEKKYSHLKINKEDSKTSKSTEIGLREVYYRLPDINTPLSSIVYTHEKMSGEEAVDRHAGAAKVNPLSRMSLRAMPDQLKSRAQTALRPGNRDVSASRERGETPARQRPSATREIDRAQSCLRNIRVNPSVSSSAKNNPTVVRSTRKINTSQGT